MATALAEKLKIKTGFSLLTMNAPPDFLKELGKLPADVTVSEKARSFDQLHWFVTTRAQVDKQLQKVFKLCQPGVTVWAYYPKVTSRMQTDLSRDKGWDSLLKEEDKFRWISLVSFNDTWSAFGFRIKTEEDKINEAKPKPERELFKYVNTETREIKLPEDLEPLLKKNKTELTYFNSLSFTCKKEYIEWIVSAKKEETRQNRVQRTIEMLRQKKKNPSDKG